MIGWLGWIVLILIVMLLTGYCSYRIVRPDYWFDGNEYNWGGLVFWIPVSLFFSLFVFMIISLIFSTDPFNRYERVERNSITTYIYSIGLHDNVNGHFTLGCGTVESKPVYYYYKKSGDGYILDRVNAEQCTIIETDNTKPNIKHIKYWKEGEASWFKKAYFGKNEELWRPCGDTPSTTKYIIYLPKGSIMQNYDISL